MIIYIDSEYKCYTFPGDNLTAIDTSFFDGKCKAYIEGYRFVPSGETWIREDGQVVAPWRPYEILTEFQAIYEEEQVKQADMAAALDVLGVSE